MPTNTDKKYYAFISYKREDEEWAKWLQNKLEHYKLPSNLNGRSDLPKEIRPIFRDQSDLAGGVLAEEINKALENSQYLIVICSPKSAQSEWVGKEVQTFIKMGRTDKIIPFIVGGEPHSENLEEECLPLSLKNLPKEQELLGVNINEMGRDAAAVKVVARMFGLRFDELWQRHEREKKHRRNWIITASVAAFLVMFGIAGWIWHQNVMLKKQRWEMLENQSKFVSKEVIANAKTDSYLARRVALAMLPKDIANPTDRPYTAEAEMALRKACDYNSAILNIGVRYADVRFNKDGTQIIVVADNTLTYYDKYNVNVLKSIIKDYDFYLSDISPDGTRLLTICDSALIILDANTCDCVKTIVEDGHFSSAKYNKTGDKIITTNDYDYYIKIWDSNTGEQIKTIYCGEFVYDATLSPNEKIIVCGTTASVDMDGTHSIKILDVETGKEIKTILKYDYGSTVNFAVFSPDGSKLITNSESVEETYIMWDTETWEAIFTEPISADYSWISDVEFSCDGKSILTMPSPMWASHNNSLKIIDADTGEEKQILYGHVFVVLGAHFSPDCRQVVSTSLDGTLRLWDVDDKRGLNVLTKADYPKNTSISSDGKRRLCVNGYGLAAVDYENDTIWKTRGYSASFSASFSSDDKMVVSASNYMAVLDSETGEEIVVFPREHTNPLVFEAKFNSDGKRIVSGSADGTARIWDIEKGICTKVLEGHTDAVLRVCYSPDSKYIATASADETIRVWNAETGDCIHVVDHPHNNINIISFSSDGKHVITATRDSIVRQYDFPLLQDLIDQTRERFKDRQLTEEERKMYYLE